MNHYIQRTLFLFLFPVTLSGKHSLQYLYTMVTSGIHFPEFSVVSFVDGEQFVYYDSKIKEMIPKVDWIKKISADDPHYWNRETDKLHSDQEWFKFTVSTLMQRFNQPTGVHTLQRMFGCELDDDNNTRGYRKYGYDGEDFISLDLNTGTWIADKPEALITKLQWESGKGAWNGKEHPHYWKSYVEKECIEWLKRFVSYGRETLERKVRPETSLFQKNSSPPEVVCHAIGFSPKSVNITWHKNGKEVHEDVDVRETLPNQDGSFQKRSILKVPAENLQKHKYTCVIQHSSLEKELVLEVPKGGALIGIIVGVIVGLLVLVAVVAGIVVWKKKNSGERKKKNSGERKKKNSGERKKKNSGERKKKNSGFKPVPKITRSSTSGDSPCSSSTTSSSSSSASSVTSPERKEEKDEDTHSHKLDSKLENKCNEKRVEEITLVQFKEPQEKKSRQVGLM